MVEFARIWRDMPKIVFSRTLERADWNTTVVRDVVPEAVMKRSRHSPAETWRSAGPTSPQ
jgi:hypothetical protein